MVFHWEPRSYLTDRCGLSNVYCGTFSFWIVLRHGRRVQTCINKIKTPFWLKNKAHQNHCYSVWPVVTSFQWYVVWPSMIQIRWNKNFKKDVYLQTKNVNRLMKNEINMYRNRHSRVSLPTTHARAYSLLNFYEQIEFSQRLLVSSLNLKFCRSAHACANTYTTRIHPHIVWVMHTDTHVKYFSLRYMRNPLFGIRRRLPVCLNEINVHLLVIIGFCSYLH